MKPSDRQAIAHLLTAAAIIHRAEAKRLVFTDADASRDARSVARELETRAELALAAAPETFESALKALTPSTRAWLQRTVPLVHQLIHRSSTSLVTGVAP